MMQMATAARAAAGRSVAAAVEPTQPLRHTTRLEDGVALTISHPAQRSRVPLQR
jgi:hypothetical protein